MGIRRRCSTVRQDARRRRHRVRVAVRERPVGQRCRDWEIRLSAVEAAAAGRSRVQLDGREMSPARLGEIGCGRCSPGRLTDLGTVTLHLEAHVWEGTEGVDSSYRRRRSRRWLVRVLICSRRETRIICRDVTCHAAHTAPTDSLRGAARSANGAPLCQGRIAERRVAGTERGVCLWWTVRDATSE